MVTCQTSPNPLTAAGMQPLLQGSRPAILQLIAELFVGAPQDNHPSTLALFLVRQYGSWRLSHCATNRQKHMCAAL